MFVWIVSEVMTNEGDGDIVAPVDAVRVVVGIRSHVLDAAILAPVQDVLRKVVVVVDVRREDRRGEEPRDPEGRCTGGGDSGGVRGDAGRRDAGGDRGDL